MPQAPVKRDNECLTNEKSQESGWYRDYESSLEQGRFCFISQCQAAEQIDKLACKIAQTFGTTSNIEHEHAVRQCADDAWDCGKLRKQREQSRLIKPNQA